MFKNLTTSVFFVLLGVTALSFVANANTPTTMASHTAPRIKDKTVTLSVPSMTCSVCPITVRKALENVSGVRKVTVSFKKKLIVVTFSPEKTNVKTLIKATADVGYSSSLEKQPNLTK